MELMNIKAYVLCKVSSGSERETCRTMAESPFVSEANTVYGEYDIIAEIRVQDLEKLDLAIEEIRTIPSITYTSTLIVGRECKDRGKLAKPKEP
jgi:DNA-binding Lrp family transcriptional regulator